MPYVEPTAVSFKARFPEFVPVADALINLILAEAIPMAGETWLERDRAPAQMYYAAHLLAIQGYPARAVAPGSGSGSIDVVGPMKRRRVGDVETEYAGTSSTSSGSGSGSGNGDSFLESTAYGRQYLEIRNRNFRGALAL
jgi:hypothetical protein